MFETIVAAPPDPILGLTEAFKKDKNPNKVNLGVGVYKDAAGQTPILNSVKRAEERLLKNENTKNYLPIDGQPEFDRATVELLFGAGHPVLAAQRTVTLLGDLLRSTLANPGVQQVSLREELTFLRPYLEIEEIRCTTTGDLLKVDVVVFNDESDEERLQYKFRWMDAEGMRAADEESWKPVLLYGNSRQTVTTVAPNPKVRNFKFIVMGQ